MQLEEFYFAARAVVGTVLLLAAAAEALMDALDDL